MYQASPSVQLRNSHVGLSPAINMVKSVELTLGKDAATRVGEITLDGKAKVTATSHPKVRKAWRVMAIAGKKVKAADVQMALGMAQSKGKPYKVRFALPEKVKAAEGEPEEEEELVEDDEVIIEEIDEEDWEGDEGNEMTWADVAKAETEAAEAAAAEAVRREEERKAAAIANVSAIGTAGKKKSKVANPFGV